MKILYLLLCFVSLTAWSQSQDSIFIVQDSDHLDDVLQYKIDTFVHDGSVAGLPILVGTSKLGWTANQQNAKGYGLYFEEVEISDCINSKSVESEETSIQAVFRTDSTVIVELQIVENCCHEFLCDIQILNGNTLNLIYYAYGNTYCACNCCYGLNYHLSIPYNDERLKEIQYVAVNGSEKTLTSFK